MVYRYLVPGKPVRYWPARPAAKRPVRVRRYPTSTGDVGWAGRPSIGGGGAAGGAGRVAAVGAGAILGFRRR